MLFSGSVLSIPDTTSRRSNRKAVSDSEFSGASLVRKVSQLGRVVFDVGTVCSEGGKRSEL